MRRNTAVHTEIGKQVSIAEESVRRCASKSVRCNGFSSGVSIAEESVRRCAGADGYQISTPAVVSIAEESVRRCAVRYDNDLCPLL